MDAFIILPTQLYPWPKSFWAKWKTIIIIEEPHYINSRMHPTKLWMHRASMLEYFESIKHPSKRYIRGEYSLPAKFTMGHPTDAAMVKKYRKATFINTPGFILKNEELSAMDTSVQNVFYKRMRIKLDLLMHANGKPFGGKWSYDSSNRKRYPDEYEEIDAINGVFNNKYIRKTRLRTNATTLHWPTNRVTAMKQLRLFVKNRLVNFGPYQDAMRQDVIVGHHSCLSASLNIGLITPADAIREVLKYKIPVESLEGFLRQVIGWREFIRMRYVLHGMNDWSYLKNMNKSIDKSWYTGTTGIETLDWSIQRVLQHAYAPHIERLMLLANYAVLMRLKYKDVHKWFVELFIDGYDWVMLNVTMGVNSLNNENRFMTRAYLTNGTYLKRMGLKISKKDEEQLKQLYDSFIRDNKELAKKDYRLAAAVKRLTS